MATITLIITVLVLAKAHRLLLADYFGVHHAFYLSSALALSCHLLYTTSDICSAKGWHEVDFKHYHTGWPTLFAACLFKIASLVCGGCSGVLIAWIVALMLPKPKPVNVRSSKAAECLDIIKTKHLPQRDVDNALEQYESRARPNQRLVAAFHIRNCFTTSEKAVCLAFRAKAVPLLQVGNAKWAAWADGVKEVVRHELSPQTTELSLFAVVQMVSLKSVMQPLFDLKTENHDKDGYIRDLADEINKQWLRSKGKCEAETGPSWAFKKQVKLQQALKAAFPGWDENDDDTNPLNFILPGYETMWRVVLRCFLELTIRGGDEAATWQQRLEAFTNNPTLEQLESSSEEDGGVSAAHIAQEALRLYPPTRRVYREFQSKYGRVYNAAADIETCHRDVDVWGDDALLFRPARWSGLDKKFEEANFMPFGTHPFMCPAKMRPSQGRLPFGISMIALLVGTLTAQVADKWRVEGSLPGEGVPLETDREAYGNLTLVRLGMEKETNT